MGRSECGPECAEGHTYRGNECAAGVDDLISYGGRRKWEDTRARMNLDESRVEEIKERAKLEQALQDHASIIAALVRKYGEPIGTDFGVVYRASLTEDETTRARGELRSMMDPDSGALLLRFRPA